MSTANIMLLKIYLVLFLQVLCSSSDDIEDSNELHISCPCWGSQTNLRDQCREGLGLDGSSSSENPTAPSHTCLRTSNSQNRMLIEYDPLNIFELGETIFCGVGGTNFFQIQQTNLGPRCTMSQSDEEGETCQTTQRSLTEEEYIQCQNDMQAVAAQLQCEVENCVGTGVGNCATIPASECNAPGCARHALSGAWGCHDIEGTRDPCLGFDEQGIDVGAATLGCTQDSDCPEEELCWHWRDGAEGFIHCGGPTAIVGICAPLCSVSAAAITPQAQAESVNKNVDMGGLSEVQNIHQNNIDVNDFITNKKKSINNNNKNALNVGQKSNGNDNLQRLRDNEESKTVNITFDINLSLFAIVIVCLVGIIAVVYFLCYRSINNK